MWNRKLKFSVKWNKSTRRKAYFTLRSNISRPKGISHCEAIFRARRVFHKSWKDLFRWKNGRFFIKIYRLFWCRWPESNRHGVAPDGFWVRCVCQFHHSGILNYLFSTRTKIIITHYFPNCKTFLQIFLISFQKYLYYIINRNFVFILHY